MSRYRSSLVQRATRQGRRPRCALRAGWADAQRPPPPAHRAPDAARLYRPAPTAALSLELENLDERLKEAPMGDDAPGRRLCRGCPPKADQILL